MSMQKVDFLQADADEFKRVVCQIVELAFDDAMNGTGSRMPQEIASLLLETYQTAHMDMIRDVYKHARWHHDYCFAKPKSTFQPPVTQKAAITNIVPNPANIPKTPAPLSKPLTDEELKRLEDKLSNVSVPT